MKGGERYRQKDKSARQVDPLPASPKLQVREFGGGEVLDGIKQRLFKLSMVCPSPIFGF
jgi:hypothetical protein